MLVLLIRSISITIPMETILSIILAVGAKQLSEHKAIVTHIEAIEQLASVAILYSNRTGLLTSSELAVENTNVKKYSNVETDETMHYAAIASLTENPNAM